MLENIYLQFFDSLYRESGLLPLEITLPPVLARGLARSLAINYHASPLDSLTFTWNTPYGPVQITSASYA